MVPSSNFIRLRYIGLLLLLVLVTIVNTSDCPEDCKCQIISNTYRSYNHAECKSLNGLKQIGKNSDIHSLDLSSIGLRKITNQLDKLTNLWILNLSHNNLTETFRLNKRVKSLDLSHNRITSGKLGKLPQFVKYLNLSNNDITYLPKLNFTKLKLLSTIDLTGNPINCTCETLEVRNFFQDNNVWTDNQINCMSPLKYKGQSWLHVKHADVCGTAGGGGGGGYNWDDLDDENEVMLGDQPIFDDGSGELKLDEDEIEPDFLPVDIKPKNDESFLTDMDYLGSGDDDVFQENETKPSTERKSADLELEGSGTGAAIAADIIMRNLNLALTTTSYDNTRDYDGDDDDDNNDDVSDTYDDDGSGSGGGGLLFIPNIPRIIDTSDNDADKLTSPVTSSTTSIESDDDDDDDDDVAIPPRQLNIFAGGRGVHKFDDKDDTSSSSAAPVTEEFIKPIKTVNVNTASKSDTEIINPSNTDDNIKGNIAVQPPSPGDTDKLPQSTAEESENKGTFILLGIIVVLLISLIIFVAVKRKRSNKRRNRRSGKDAENPAGTELLDMDNRKLGKPIPISASGGGRNGNVEKMPLMPSNRNGDNQWDQPNNKNRSDLNNAQEPLLKKLNDTVDEPENLQQQQPLNTFKPIGKVPLSEQPTKQNGELPDQKLPQQQPEETKTSPQLNEEPKRKSFYENQPNEIPEAKIPSSYPPTEKQQPQQQQQQPPPQQQPTTSPMPIPRKEPIVPVHQSPALQNGHPETDDNDEVFKPISPRPTRYSPVYSPETGRVKIKLTETPKPKTPILVTRSRSNAGDIITTQNLLLAPPTVKPQ